MASIPAINFKWITDVDEFQNRVETIKHEAISTYDRISKENSITFQNIAQTLADCELIYSTQFNLMTLYQSVHPDKRFRDASTEANKALSDLLTDLSMRKDVFDQLVKLKEACGNQLSPQREAYLAKKIKEGKHNGLCCSETVRNEVEALTKEIGRLSIAFTRNLSEENSLLEFADSELEGCSAAFIDSLPKTNSGKREVSLKYPHYFPIMKLAMLPDTRHRIQLAFNSRCKVENGPILENILQLRAKRAKLLGYENHADYILSMRMAKDSKTVWKFIQDLKDKFRPLMQEELATFLQYKKQLCDKLKIEFNNRIDPPDLLFFMNIYEKEKFSVDQKKLEEYFPLETVRKGMFDIYEHLLGLKFLPIVADSWHPDVEMFSVEDATNGNLLGYFFLDLHPREGKYGHARIFPIQLGGVSEYGMGDPVRQVGVVAIVANFTKSTTDRPALLNHDEVVTFFHEFGHVMHVICAHVDFVMLHPCDIERDFLECPSQMLENWCWQKETLKMMSGHYKTGEPIDDELLANLFASRVASSGVVNTRQLSLACFDQIIHTTVNVDPVAVFSDIFKDYLGISVTEGTNFPATFNHIVDFYDAQYYGYLWSQVFAADLFGSRFLKEGILNPSTGRDYRELILRPGSSRDPSDLILDFLGRPANQDAFLVLMGVNN